MDLTNLNEIKELLYRHGFHFSKSLGQNFLIEKWVIRDTVEAANIDESCGVLEVGPGIGPLTKELLFAAGKVVSVELDQKLFPVLEETLGSFDNFTLLQGDIMKMNIKEIVADHFQGLTPVFCANLPYNITTPILTALCKSKVFDSLTVLIQKEVAQRICAKPGTADYGAFSILMQYYSVPEIVITVPNTCFYPAPKVASAVIHCEMRKEPPVKVKDEEYFWKTVRAGFALRRKTLVNSLQTAFPFSKDILSDAIQSCGFNTDIRGERLSLYDYAKLADYLYDLQ